MNFKNNTKLKNFTHEGISFSSNIGKTKLKEINQNNGFFEMSFNNGNGDQDVSLSPQNFFILLKNGNLINLEYSIDVVIVKEGVSVYLIPINSEEYHSLTSKKEYKMDKLIKGGIFNIITDSEEKEYLYVGKTYLTTYFSPPFTDETFCYSSIYIDLKSGKALFINNKEIKHRELKSKTVINFNSIIQPLLNLCSQHWFSNFCISEEKITSTEEFNKLIKEQDILIKNLDFLPS